MFFVESRLVSPSAVLPRNAAIKSGERDHCSEPIPTNPPFSTAFIKDNRQAFDSPNQIRIRMARYLRGQGYPVYMLNPIGMEFGQFFGVGWKHDWLETAENTPFLENELITAIFRINPGCSPEALAAAINRILHFPRKPLEMVNSECINMLTHGVSMDFHHEGMVRREFLNLLHPSDGKLDSCCALTGMKRFVEEGCGDEEMSSPWLIFLNGLLVALIFLQKPEKDDNKLTKAYQQFIRFKERFPEYLAWNAVVALSDGYFARAGSLTAPLHYFFSWSPQVPSHCQNVNESPLSLLMEGLFDPDSLKKIVRHFTQFRFSPVSFPYVMPEILQLEKVIAMAHQYEAVELAADSIRSALTSREDLRGGIIHHALGAGKSLTMAFLAARLLSDPLLTPLVIIVVTDRIDLENQLFEVFASWPLLAGMNLHQARNRRHLRHLLHGMRSGIIFTTIHKFRPMAGLRYSPRFNPLVRNTLLKKTVVFADEAHRSHYGLETGLAFFMRATLPTAVFIAFTATPLQSGTPDTVSLFGACIHFYGETDAIRDGIITPTIIEDRSQVLYEFHSARKRFDGSNVEEREGEDEIPSAGQGASCICIRQEGKKNIGVGLIMTLAKDIVQHVELRRRNGNGKALVAVNSRSEAAALYHAIIALRPLWHDNNDCRGMIKAVMSGGPQDPAELQPHIRNGEQNRLLAKRLKNQHDPLFLAIVCDMWLTGFDAPVLDTLYLLKPLKGTALTQAMGRINRIFPGKKAGLVADYLGLSQIPGFSPSTVKISEYSFFPRMNPTKALDLLTKESFRLQRTVLPKFHGEWLNAGVDGYNTNNSFLSCLNLDDDAIRQFLLGVGKMNRASRLAAGHPDIHQQRLKMKILNRNAWLIRHVLKPRKHLKSTVRHPKRSLPPIIALFGKGRRGNETGSEKINDVFCPFPGFTRFIIRFAMGEPMTALTIAEMLFNRVWLPRGVEMGYLRHIRRRVSGIVKHGRCNGQKAGEALTALEQLGRSWRFQELLRGLFDMKKDEYSIARILFIEITSKKQHDLLDTWIRLKQASREIAVIIRLCAAGDWFSRESGVAKFRVSIKHVLKQYALTEYSNSGLQAVLREASLIAEEQRRIRTGSTDVWV